MYAYILLVAMLGSATAAPLASQVKVETKAQEAPAAAPLLLKEANVAAAAPLLAEAPISAPAVAAAPAIATSGAAPSAVVAEAAPTALKAGVPSPKALSLISEIRSPLIAPVITPLATPIISTRQIAPYIYTAPAIAPLELAAAPSSYSIEQHGYRITY